jgi:hypothetical protein
MLSDLRDRLKDDRSATYTYGPEFQSLVSFYVPVLFVAPH